MMNKESLGLYIHVPFCRSKCTYCDFYSLPGRETDRQKYTEELIRRLSSKAEVCNSYRVDTVYFGGGTPSLLSGEQVQSILNAVQKAYDVSEDAEITMECNPDSTGKKWLEEIRLAGVNRLSFGVQSSNDAQLKKIGRRHDYEQAVQAFHLARETEFDNISLDLIYGLPGETSQTLQSSIRSFLELQPEHISCYGLKVEDGTKLASQVEKHEFSLPDDDSQADDYLMICEELENAGYKHYEISNFAKPGYESRHNLRYWKLQSYLGFGPAAHSDFEGVRYGYTRDLNAFLMGEEHFSEKEKISELERNKEKIMLGLRISEGIPRNTCSDELFRMFERSGLITETENRICLTDRGYLVSNAVILKILENK